ncbi:MAG TPA: galactose-1-phosphate uridylyltransferase [Planctomycetota bacterium]|nr:galactose-1-phosphate uridylyltransferase [Planctomycetota bacterium]
MPELRKDPVIGRWVIIATERGARPTDFKSAPQVISRGFCPFCEGNEDKTPPEIVAIRDYGNRDTKGWRVRVVSNKFPALQIEGGLDKRGEGIYDLMRGVGAHEVIIETPEHVTSLTSLSVAQIDEVLTMYSDRLNDLKKDKRFAYGLVFKNVGSIAGASLEHTHSQLIVTPVVPITVSREMGGCREFFDYRGRCLMCDMLKQETSNGGRVVIDGDQYVSFEPFASRFPFETWILPKKHRSHFEVVPHDELGELADVLKESLVRIESALENPPYNYIIHSAPFTVQDLEFYHWHIEIIPRLTKVAGFEWGTGFYINPVPPEKAAEFLRGVEK